MSHVPLDLANRMADIPRIRRGDYCRLITALCHRTCDHTPELSRDELASCAELGLKNHVVSWLDMQSSRV
jgi:hypothetical protein